MTTNVWLEHVSHHQSHNVWLEQVSHHQSHNVVMQNVFITTPV